MRYLRGRCYVAGRRDSSCDGESHELSPLGAKPVGYEERRAPGFLPVLRLVVDGDLLYRAERYEDLPAVFIPPLDPRLKDKPGEGENFLPLAAVYVSESDGYGLQAEVALELRVDGNGRLHGAPPSSPQRARG